MKNRRKTIRHTKHADYDYNVFINCPFDKDFKELFRAMVFTIHVCGFAAQCALEDNNQTNRLQRIMDLIGECRFGIHDLSRIDIGKMPRNNMPLELGLFMGCRQFGLAHDQLKEYLVLDSDPHRYKQHITDLGGEDPSSHDNKPELMIDCVRNWLRPYAKQQNGRFIPSTSILVERYSLFKAEAPAICAEYEIVFSELEFPEYQPIVVQWLKRGQAKLKALQDLDKNALQAA